MPKSKPMKWVTVSKAHIERMHAVKYMSEIVQTFGVEWHLVVHTNKQRQRLLRQGFSAVRAEHVHVSNTVPPIPQAGAAIQREWAEHNLIDENEWYVTIDDNVQQLNGLPREHWPEGRDKLTKQECMELRKQMFQVLPAKEVLRRVNALKLKCLEMGTVLGSFAYINNALFRAKHWREVAYSNTTWSVRKRCGLNWRPWKDAMWEDFITTCEAVSIYGCAPKDDWTGIKQTAYETGGIGCLQDRIAPLTKDCNNLLAMYPGLLKPIKNRPFHLTFTKYSKTAVEKWQRSYDANLRANAWET
jgi:hypothetical protein|tara:strand:- start:2253 stop:3155 length:903 start_codon:yes stop_codon:yes gene_type:complete